MKIFITGASGFVGGAIGQKLKANHTIYAMARSEKSAKKVKSLGFIPVMTALNKVTTEDLNASELVIHSAAYVESWGTRDQYWTMNVEGTRQLLEVARKGGVKRFIHIGTEACLFHGQSMNAIDETYPYAENSPYLYSETKAVAEKIVLAANLSEVFETMSLRPRMVWGPGDQTILPELLKMVDKGSFIWINKGQAKTSSTHIANFVHGTALAIQHGQGGEAYFITDDEILSIKDFITGLLASQNITPSGKSISPSILRPLAYIVEKTWRLFGIKNEPPITRFAADIMSVDCTINIDKARSQLHYSPVISISDGMKELANH